MEKILYIVLGIPLLLAFLLFIGSMFVGGIIVSILVFMAGLVWFPIRCLIRSIGPWGLTAEQRELLKKLEVLDNELRIAKLPSVSSMYLDLNPHYEPPPRGRSSYAIEQDIRSIRGSCRSLQIADWRVWAVRW